MPTSTYSHIPLVCHWVSELQPQSILDVGVGFGKWGHLFREQLDISPAAVEPQRYFRPNWKGRLDGIEGFEPYVTDLHRFLYDNVYIGDMTSVIKTVGAYDVIFIGDVIEHVEKEAGIAFLREALNHANKAVIVSTPAYEMEQYNVCGNVLEDHKSLWHAADFRAFGNTLVRVVQSKVLVAALLKPGVRPPGSPSPMKSMARALLIRTLGEKRYKRLGGR